MKSMKELKDLEMGALQSKLAELKKEQFALNAKKSTGALEKPAALSQLRKQIARVMTLIRAKQGGRNTKNG